MGRKIREQKTKFTAGELDDILLAQTLLPAYENGCNKMRNVAVQPQGGAQRRPGAPFQKQLPFVFEDLDLSAMTMPEGGTVANIIDNDATTSATTTTAVGVLDPYVIAQIDLGAPTAVQIVTAENLSLTVTPLADEVRFQHSPDGAVWTDYGTPFDLVDATSKNFSHQENVTAQHWRLARVGATDAGLAVFTLGEFEIVGIPAALTLSNVRLKPFQFSTEQNYQFAFTDQAVGIYKDGVLQATLITPYTSDVLPAISVLQSLDTMLVFHEDIQTQEIFREGSDTLWSISPVTYTNIPQFDFGSGDEDVWSDTRGWPRCATFHSGRLWVAGSRERPQTFWASVSNDFFNFDKGTSLDDEAIDATLDTDAVASIFNLYSGRHLQIFTSSGEFYVTPENDVITPTNIDAKRSTQVGSSGPGVPVIALEGATLFVQRLGNGIREFIFTDLNNPYEANPLSLRASNLIDDPVEFAARRALKVTEGDLVFATNTDGSLAVLQTLRSQDITGWQLWQTEGAIRATNVDFDNVYWAVERQINGETRLYLEQLSPDAYLDASVLYTTDAGSPTVLPATVLTGLDHLEGETVRVRADGSVLEDQVVVGGSVTLEREAETTAEVGLSFPDVQELEVERLQVRDGHTEVEAREIVYRRPDVTEGDGAEVWIRDMPVDFNLNGFASMGLKLRVVEITLRLNKTTGLYIAANAGEPHEVIFRKFGSNLLDEPPPLFTGDKTIEGLLGYSEVDFVDITQRNPVPMLILGFSKKVTI